MSDTPRLGLPQLAASQAQKHVTHNEALINLDGLVQAMARDRDLSVPPGSPVDGDAYIVAPGASGAWAGQDGNLAVSVDGAWRFAVPFEGLTVWLEDEALHLIYHAGTWNDAVSLMTLQNLQLVGINTAADLINRLAVKSNAVLFAALEAAQGGNGDIQFKVNKESNSNTASLLFQTNFSGRAELGLTGNDDLTIKVSPDGLAFNEAVRIRRSNNRVTFTGPVRLPVYTVATLPPPVEAASGAIVYVSNASGGSVVAFSDGTDWRRVSDLALVS